MSSRSSGKSVVGNQIRERLPFDQLQGEERQTVDFLDRVDGDDVGMVECGGGACLALEPFAPIGIAGKLARQDLESHPPLEPGVICEVDLPHATLAQQLNDSVVRQGGTNHAVDSQW